MYKTPKFSKTSLNINNTTEGETIEQKIERIVNNKEPISDGAPIIYTERKEGVQAGHNIRSDRFDIAIDAMDHVTATHRGKREERIKTTIEEFNKKTKGEGENSGAESTQGTNENPN